ncbi:MAG: adenylate/guanylate cyclase domain-containing protein, partial [Planctomycetota bacterium]
HHHYQEAGHADGIAEVCDSLANMLLKRGKTRSALKFCRRSLEMKRKLKDRYGEALTLGTLGRIYMQQARYKEARQAFQEDLAIAQVVKDERGVGIMLNSLGEVAWLLGELEVSAQHYFESIASHPGGYNELHAQLGLARVYLAADQLQKVNQAADRMEQLIQGNPNFAAVKPALKGLRGSLAWRQGNIAAGERLLREAIGTFRQRKLALATIPFLYELRDLLCKRGAITAAVSLMTEALDLLSECGADRGVDDVETWLRTTDQPGLTRLALERHFPEHLVEQILEGDLHRPEPKRQRMTVLFSDVRGFTALSEDLPPEEIVELLNEWFTEATRSVQRHGGIIDKFIGDAVMALFGVPEFQEQAAANAVRSAVEMREALQAMNLRQRALGGKELHVGIGIATGEAVLGFIGSHLHQSFTAIGDPVNTAARLETATKEFPHCDIFICETTEEEQQHHGIAQTTFVGYPVLKGKQQKVGVYHVDRLNHQRH